MKPDFYVKKPIPVQAMQFEYNAENIAALKEFLGPNLGNMVKERHPGALAEAQIITLEDGIRLTVKHIATEGDYIVKGNHNDYWPVKQNIFEATYEKIKETK